MLDVIVAFSQQTRIRDVGAKLEIVGDVRKAIVSRGQVMLVKER